MALLNNDFKVKNGLTVTDSISAGSCIEADSFEKHGGTSSQFLKADGSVDSTSYGTGSVTEVKGCTGITVNNGTGSACVCINAAQPTITSLGNLTCLVVDDITLNGSLISNAGQGHLCVCGGGDIALDSTNGDIKLRDASTDYGRFLDTSNNFIIQSLGNDKDLIFCGVDNGSNVQALRLDMSDAGSAIFNNWVCIGAGSLNIGGTAVTSTATELNLLDGFSSIPGACCTGDVTTNTAQTITGTKNFCTDICVGSKIIHTGDSDTYFQFGNNVAYIVAGNETVLAANASEVVINEPGNSNDFRVEGDTDTHALFVDGSADKVGIGTSTPTAKLTLSGAENAEPLLFLGNKSNAGGASIQFTDAGAANQFGGITFRHADSQSQGGSASFSLSSTETDLALIVGSASNSGRVVVKSGGSPNEVQYGFYDDINTGVYRPSNHMVGLVANGTERIRVESTGSCAIGNFNTTGEILSSGVDLADIFITSAQAGDITAVTTGPYLTGGGASGSVEVGIDSACAAAWNAAVAGDISAVVAGTGLTGGGTSGSVTLNISAGDGVQATANCVSVDSTVVRTTGNQTIAGTKNFCGSICVGGDIEHTGNPSTCFGFDSNQIRAHAAGGEEIFRVNGTGMVINEGGQPNDFRVEGDTDTHALFVDGSKDNVGIGTSSTENNSKLTVATSDTTALSTLLRVGSTSANQDYTALRFGNTTSSQYGDYGFNLNYEGTQSGNNNRFVWYADNQTGVGGQCVGLSMLQDGRVGVGTVSPSEALGVAGNIAVTGTVDGVDVAALATCPGLTKTGTVTNVLGCDGITVTNGTGSACVNVDCTVVRTTGAQTIAGTKNFCENICVGGNIYHTGDSDTRILLETNTITLLAGNEQHLKVCTTGVVINDGGLNNDFRVEGDNDPNLLFVDGSADKVGIGCNAPSQKLAVAGDGLFTSDLTVQGDLTVTGDFTCLDTTISVTSALSVQNAGTGPALIVNQTGSNDIVDFRDDGTSAFYIEDGGNVGINDTNPGHKLDVNGNINVTGDYKMDDAIVINNTKCFVGNGIDMGDNCCIRLGVSDDLQIGHDGSNSFITDSGVGSLIISSNFLTFSNAADTEYMAKLVENEAVELYYDGSKKFETTNVGVDVTGTINFAGGASTANLAFGDNDQIQMGAGNDLRIYHDGSHSYVKDSGTGVLKLLGSGVSIQNAAGSENMLVSQENGSVDLYYDGSNKLQTTSAGINVCGTGTFTSTINGAQLCLAGSADTMIDLNQTGTDTGWSYINFKTLGTRNYYVGQDNSKNFQIYNDNIDVTAISVGFTNANVTLGADLTVSGGDITLGGTGRIQGIDTVSSGTDAANKTYADTKLALAGGTMSGDIAMGNNCITGVNNIQANGDLSLLTCTGEYAVFGSANAQTQLYYNGIKKFETTNVGIEVTGGINASGTLDISSTYPRINLNDTNHEDDWSIINADGAFTVYNVDDNVNAIHISTVNNVTLGADLTVCGGDITLGGTGRIQGVDTVSSGTDAANKTYVDTCVATKTSCTGTVDTTGTPANNQVAIFTDSNTIEGDVDLTFDGNNLNVGTTTKTSNTNLYVQAGDSCEASICLYGSSQGTGNVYVGQSSTYGGGMLYNGDGNPSRPGGNDNIVFYRRTAGTDSSVMCYAQNCATVCFAGDINICGGDITLGGTGRIQGIDTVSASTDAANKNYVDTCIAAVPTGDITTVTAGPGLCGGGTSGAVTICHCDTSSQGSVNNSNGTVIQDITLDTYGHVTGIGSCDLDCRYYKQCDVYTQSCVNTLLSGKLSTSGCAANSALLDSIDSSQFLRSDTADTASGTVNFSGDICVGDQIFHTGDSDTYLQFVGANDFRVVTGARDNLRVKETEVVINEASNDVDFRVESNSCSSMLFVDGGNNRVGIGTSSPSATLAVNGSFTATCKSFLVDNPVTGGQLKYGVVEGNEHGVTVRGTTCCGTIDLPAEWDWLVEEDSVTAQITPVGSLHTPYIVSQDNKQVVVCSSGCYNYNIYGTRKDVEPLEVNIL